jgi:hypothetical protein
MNTMGPLTGSPVGDFIYNPPGRGKPAAACADALPDIAAPELSLMGLTLCHNVAIFY